MKFFMELLSSLTIRDILAVAQLLTTSLDCILKIIELRRKSAAIPHKDRHLSVHHFSNKRQCLTGIAFSSVPTPIVYSILELFQALFINFILIIKKQILICAAAYRPGFVKSTSYNERNFSTAKFFLLPLWKSASPSISSVASHSTQKPQRLSLRLPSFLISDLRKPETRNLDEIFNRLLRRQLAFDKVTFYRGIIRACIVLADK